MRGEHLNVSRIIEYALRLDVATAKRLGWVLEESGIPLGKLTALAELPANGYTNLDPSGPRRELLHVDDLAGEDCTIAEPAPWAGRPR